MDSSSRGVAPHVVLEQARYVLQQDSLGLARFDQPNYVPEQLPTSVSKALLLFLRALFGERLAGKACRQEVVTRHRLTRYVQNVAGDRFLRPTKVESALC